MLDVCRSGNSNVSVASFDLEAYRRDGVQLIRGCLDGNHIVELHRIYDELKSRIAEGKVARSVVHTTGDHYELFDRLDQFEPIREVAASILGSNYCRLVSRFLIKDTTFSDSVMAHQDWPYFPGDTVKVNFFVPLTPAYPANGMLTFLKASHLYGPLERGAIAIDRYPELERLPIAAEVGDVLVADILTWHYSEPATEVSDRILVQMVYQPSSDPSSKHLVSGRILNSVYCAERATPLESQVSAISYSEAKARFDVQDYQGAERIGLGILATDPHNVRVMLLLKRLYALQNDAAKQNYYLDLARAEAEASLEACANEC